MSRTAVHRRGDEPAPRRAHRWKRWLGIGFTVLVLGLVGWAAHKVRWPEVLAALAAYPASTLAAAGLAAAAAHLFYTVYDVLGAAWAGHRLPIRRVMQVSFTSYTFNLNLGTLVGAVAMRARMYARLGLESADIGRVVAFSMVSNWLGYAFLAGLVFSAGAIELPAEWALSEAALRALGGALILATAGYLAWCGLARRRRSFSVRGHVLTLPPLRIALAQLAASCAHWLATAGILYLLLGERVAYPEVLATFLVAAIAGGVAHVPAGLGVLEAVCVALLSPQVPQHGVIAALLAFRAVYHWLPLLLAIGLYVLIESRPKRVATA